VRPRSEELEQLQDVACAPIRLDQATRRLNAELSRLRSEVDPVQGERVILGNNRPSQQGVAGVGIVLLGLVAGMIMRSRSGRRRNSGWAT